MRGRPRGGAATRRGGGLRDAEYEGDLLRPAGFPRRGGDRDRERGVLSALSLFLRGGGDRERERETVRL